MKRHFAWIDKDFETLGIASLVVARERTEGWCEVAVFLVDMWCLGVKDVVVFERSRGELDSEIRTYIPEGSCEPIDPACARKLVEGAAAYAQSLGFLPARDFRKARKTLGGIDAKACTREFTFGRDGQPHFLAGPDDSPERISRVCAILEARFGPDGFRFTMPDSDDDDVSDRSTGIDGLIEEYYAILDRRAERGKGTGSFGADAIVAGAAVMPDPIPMEECLAAISGQPVTDFDGFEEGEPDVVEHATRHLHARVANTFALGQFRPELPPPSDSRHAEVAAAYCRGFLAGLALRPAILAELRQRPETARALEVFDAAGAQPETTLESPPVGIRAHDRGGPLGEAIATLYRALRPSEGAPSTAP